LPALLNDLAAAAAPLKASIAYLEVMATVVCTLLTLPHAKPPVCQEAEF
jgi:hypothetical protein